MREIGGKTLLSYVLDRVLSVEALETHAVVATTERDVDNQIADWCETESIPVFRGSAEDVAGRALQCARACGWSAFFRINGDSPFVDPALLTKALRIYMETEADLVTNLLPRTYPYGVSVELFKTAAFARAYANMSSPDELEHVSKYFYDRPEQFAIRNIERSGENLSLVRLTVDSIEDWGEFEQAVCIAGESLGRMSHEEVVSLYRRIRQ